MSETYEVGRYTFAVVVGEDGLYTCTMDTGNNDDVIAVGDTPEAAQRACDLAVRDYEIDRRLPKISHNIFVGQTDTTPPADTPPGEELEP